MDTSERKESHGLRVRKNSPVPVRRLRSPLYWGLRDDPDGAATGPGGTVLPDDIARDESNQVFDFEVASDSGFDTYSVDNLGGGNYRMYAEDGTGIDFEHSGDPEDHYGVQDKATAALKARGIINDDTWIS